ncbi:MULTISPECIES: hypothetical protein [Mycobacteriaceae]|uniref:hypothetical protein n=1 Tax=Mycobacteriaceae TaxID=1762 RepID=UPI000A507817|nr:hypothetical protein [Mycolicibacterium mucogenicum]
MAVEANGGTRGSSIRGRDALVASGALIPALCPENLRDLATETASRHDRTLTDILLKMRDENHATHEIAFATGDVVELAETENSVVLEVCNARSHTVGDGID